MRVEFFQLQELAESVGVRLEISTQIASAWSRIVHTSEISTIGDSFDFGSVASWLTCVDIQLMFLALFLGQAGVLPRLYQLSIEVGSEVHVADDWRRRTGMAREPQQFPALEVIKIYRSTATIPVEVSGFIISLNELQAFVDDLDLGTVYARSRPRLQLYGVQLDGDEGQNFDFPLQSFKI